jgi:hypothetical protein
VITIAAIVQCNSRDGSVNRPLVADVSFIADPLAVDFISCQNRS